MTHDTLAAVRAGGLVKRYGPVVAVDDVTFTIRRNECFGFLGPNGAGKTTTMRMICCLSHRDAGSLDVLDADPDRDARTIKARLGVVAQEINLDLELTVRENLLVYARYFDIPRREARSRADELLAFVELTDRADAAVEHLSGGMKRRVQIARALINQPDVVVLDEPTTGLDPHARHLVWDRLRALKERGVTLILTTHYMDEAEQLCDRLVVMDHGHIVREGSPGSLIAETVGSEVVELQVAASDVARLTTDLRRTPADHRLRGDVLTLFTNDGEGLLHAARATGVPVTLRMIRRATLEDVFLAVTGHDLHAVAPD